MENVEQLAKMEEDVEAAFKRHQSIMPQVKQEYDKVIGQVFADLSPSDLQAFSDILLEHEDSVLDTEELVNTMRTQMTTVLGKMNQFFFDKNDVENKLVTLEVLKEKFAPYEGKDWNSLSPEELTRPLRMRLLDSSIRFMERQLEAQQKDLEISMAKSKANRERLQTVQNERVKLTAKMEQQTAQYKDIRQLLELQHSINNSYLPPEN
ncbi:uncharacterized protein Nnf1a [Drosophila kikkawai]|uniref:Uncharacterized protein Nnf1a n=1 Tax=Drosophila kikkawai TaxID=30033 RepID=A0A6P4IA46_DROKI|nr:uncharacterized protein LOC108076649 [Drosophila kikkawai]KAH8301438.1 hypothetical protein KR059_003364 [Drosophila kikkawai]